MKSLSPQSRILLGAVVVIAALALAYNLLGLRAKTSATPDLGGATEPAAERGAESPAENPDPAVTPLPEAETERAPEAEATPSPQTELLQFAHGLAGLMERAEQSEDAAVEGFAELERCVNDPGARSAPQKRMICFANAKRLADQYPSALRERMSRLERRNERLSGAVEATGL